MNQYNKDMYIIQDYLDGKLTEQQKQIFEDRLKQEDDLREEFENQVFIREGFKGMQMQRFQAEVQTWEDALKQQDHKIKTLQQRNTGKWNYLWAVAASVMLLSFFGGRWWVHHTYSNQALAADLFQDPNDFKLQSKGGQTMDPNALQQGIAFYEKENYEAAAALCATIPPEDKEYRIAQNYLGHSYLKTEEYPKAIEVFEQMLTRAGPNQEEVIRLNLLHAYLLSDPDSPRFQQLLSDTLKYPTATYEEKLKSLNQKLKHKILRSLAD